MRHDLPNDKTSKIPRTIQEDSPDTFPHTDEVGDGRDTNQRMEPDAEANSEQLSPTGVNSGSTKYDIRHNPKPNCNDGCR